MCGDGSKGTHLRTTMRSAVRYSLAQHPHGAAPSPVDVDAHPRNRSMYTQHDYSSKKAVKEDVARRLVLCDDKLWALQHPEDKQFTPEEQEELDRLTNRLTAYQPNADVTGFASPRSGPVTLEGPHYPKPHRWYASAELVDGVVVKAS